MCCGGAACAARWALALALSLPASLPLRDEMVGVVTFAVVAFSIVVQGLTMPPLLPLVGLYTPDIDGSGKFAAAPNIKFHLCGE